MSTIPQDSVLGHISSLIREMNGEVKTASANGTTKKATELGLTGQGKKDPGGYVGKSTHPSAMEASNVQKTPLGSRAHENETDVKEDHPGAGVDNTSGKGGTQDDKQFNVGITSKSTGEDPKVEDDYRLGKKDDKRQGDRGGTEGPFNAEEIKSSSFEQLTKTAYAKMNEILADLANGQAATETKSANAQASGARPAGIAQPAGSTAPTAQEKQAAAQAIIEQTILDARTNADLVGEYLTKYAAHYEQLLRKAAADDGMGGGAMPPEGGEGGEGAPPGAGAPPPEAGGAPPEGGQGGGPEAQLDELISALLSMGHTPEEIQQALQGLAGGQGGAGGPPPEAGGAPPGGGVPPEMAGGAGGAPPGAEMGKLGSARMSADQRALLKIAAAANQRWRSGQWKPVDVRPGTKEARERNELQNYILEVCNAR